MPDDLPTIQYIEIKNLNLLKSNPRKITNEEMQKLCDSIQNDPSFFRNRPVLVNEQNGEYNVYAGNQRVLAAKKLKWKDVPCIVEKDLDEKIIRERIIKDNKHAGDWDFDILANEWEITELIEFGFDLEELGLPSEEEIEADEEDNQVLEPAKDEDATTKLGDVYELNEHRIGCGDSTNPDFVSKVLLDNIPILMVTDPPYGVEYDPSWRKNIKVKFGVAKALGKVQNDDKINWSLAWHIFPGSIAYIWHAGKFCSEVQKSLEESEFQIVSQIIWKKQHFSLSRGDYHWHHEPCWYAVKNGYDHNWQGSRKETTIWEISNLCCFGKTKEDGEERTAHSTQKPIECMARPIRNNTAKGEGVYDPFLGSGTTLIAAQMLERRCYGLELLPAYCDIIVNRWINHMKKHNKKFTVKKNGEIIEEF